MENRKASPRFLVARRWPDRKGCACGRTAGRILSDLVLIVVELGEYDAIDSGD